MPRSPGRGGGSVQEPRSLGPRRRGRGVGARGRGVRGYARHFSGFLQTRPYMRARAGLAVALIELGDESAGIEHLRAMLKLNPNDDKGSDISPGLSAQARRAAAVKTLLAAYKDNGARAVSRWPCAALPSRTGTRRRRRLYGWCRTPGQPTSTCLRSGRSNRLRERLRPGSCLGRPMGPA